MSPGMQKLNVRLEEMEQWLDNFALATQQSFHQIDENFKRVDRNIDELKHEVYSNGDALARIIKTMDQEFAASRIQMNRLEGRVERLEHAQGLA